MCGCGCPCGHKNWCPGACAAHHQNVCDVRAGAAENPRTLKVWTNQISHVCLHSCSCVLGILFLRKFGIREKYVVGSNDLILDRFVLCRYFPKSSHFLRGPIHKNQIRSNLHFQILAFLEHIKLFLK